MAEQLCSACGNRPSSLICEGLCIPCWVKVGERIEASGRYGGWAKRHSENLALKHQVTRSGRR